MTPVPARLRRRRLRPHEPKRLAGTPPCRLACLLIKGRRAVTPLSPTEGQKDRRGWGEPWPPQYCEGTSDRADSPVAARATIGTCVHRPHGEPGCKAAFPSRPRLAKKGEPRIRDRTGSAEPQCSLCRRRRVGTAVATSAASGTSASQSGAVPIGHAAARIPRRASVRAPAVPHQPGRRPSSRGAFQRWLRACAYSAVGLAPAALGETMPVTATCVGASGTLRLRGNRRRAETVVFHVLGQDTLPRRCLSRRPAADEGAKGKGGAVGLVVVVERVVPPGAVLFLEA